MSGLPAARIHDAVDHRADGDIIEGSPNVFIGGVGRRAARLGDKVKHGWGTCVITEGEPTVRINGKPAARITDSVSCGGHIAKGHPRTHIGKSRGKTAGNIQAGQKMCINAAKGRKSGQTSQSYNNCGIESSRQLINQVTGRNITEDDLLQYALNHNEAGRGSPPDTQRGDPPVPFGTPPRWQDGGSTAYQRQALLTDFGIPSTVEENNLSNISQALASGKGVMADTDASILWKGVIPDNQLPKSPAFHEITITGIEYDDNGNITNVIINDTGTGNCSRKIPVDQWNKAVQAVRDAGYSAQINVTSKPIF
jgi:uncharacterized Zn-binding protein involved in type VI secretion